MAKRRTNGEGSVFYDKSRDRWVGLALIDGRRRKVTAKTRIDVSAKLGQLIHGDPAERDADRSTTVAALLRDWQAKSLEGRNLAPSTVEVHRWACNLWTEELGGVKLADLDVDRVEAALARMATRDKPLSKASLTKARGTLRQALNWALRRRAVTYNAAAVAELPTDIPDTRPRRALTPEELAAVLDALDGHPLRPMFMLSGRVGLRPGEASAVCVDALDLEGDPPTVAVVRGVQIQHGHPVLVDDLKTVGARRTLAMPPDVVEALRDHLAGHQGDGLLFAASDGGPLWPTTVRAELAEACRTVGIEPVTPNELRHTAATIMANAGLPPHHVADILGHRSTRMVDAVYRHRPAIIAGAEGVRLD